MHRALEIGAVLGEAIRQGHPLAFVTLTMRHDQGQALADLWAAGVKGWRRAISGKGWVATQHIAEGWVRVWEVTEGRNGWHVHVHVVMVMAKGSTSADLDQLAGGMFRRWSGGLLAAGLSAPMLQGQDWHLVTGDQAAEQLAEYLAKSVSVLDRLRLAAVQQGQAVRLGLELTHTQPGRAREGLKTRPVWALLDDLAETGEVGRWWEWEKASQGKKQVGWSKGLRERFAPTIEELSDDEVVDTELGTAADDVIRWTSDQWRELVAHPGRPLDLLRVAEVGGQAAAVALLDSWGASYLVLIAVDDREGVGTPAGAVGAEDGPAPP